MNVHDLADPVLGKAIPYGIFDLTHDAGWVSVGCDHDTAAFAVAAIRSWWNVQGKASYPHAGRASRRCRTVARTWSAKESRGGRPAPVPGRAPCRATSASVR